MRRTLLLLMVLMAAATLRAQDAEVLSDSVSLVIDADNSYQYEHTRRVRLLNSKADGEGLFVFQMNSDCTLQHFTATLTDDAGTVLRKINQSELRRTDYTPELAADYYMLYLDVTPPSYPVTLTYTWRERCRANVVSFPSFCPQRLEGETVQHAVYTIHHPADYALQLSMVNSTLSPVTRQDADGTVTTLTMDALPAIHEEPLAVAVRERVPAVYLAPRRFSFFSTSGSLEGWQAMGQWEYALADGRDLLPDDIVAQLQTAVAGCTTDREKMAVLYALLGHNTRYVNIQLGIGGYQPLMASSTWHLGFGDCKALSNLMKAMLRAVGIDSHLVAISTTDRRLLPMANFQQMDHMILEVPLQDDTVYVECTNPDVPLGYVHSRIAGHDALELSPAGGRVIRLPAYDADRNRLVTTVEGQLDAEGNAAMRIAQTAHNACYEQWAPLAQQRPDDRRQALLARYHLPQATDILDSLVDQKAPFTVPQLSTVVRANSHGYAAATGRRLFVPVHPEQGPALPTLAPQRRQPIVISEGRTWTSTYTYQLPEGYAVESLPATASVACPAATYATSVTHEGQRVTIKSELQLRVGTFPAAMAADLGRVFNAAREGYRSQIILVREP